MGRKSVASKGGGSGDPRRRDQGPWQRQGEGGHGRIRDGGGRHESGPRGGPVCRESRPQTLGLRASTWSRRSGVLLCTWGLATGLSALNQPWKRLVLYSYQVGLL